MVSVLVTVCAGLLSVYGASRTQRALNKGHERDKLIDIMAWADRRLFHGGEAAGSPPR